MLLFGGVGWSGVDCSLAAGLFVRPLQWASHFLTEMLSSSGSSPLILRGLLIKVWYLLQAGITKQENLSCCTQAELTGFQHSSLGRWCKATRCVGGHIFGPPDCMPTCRFKKMKKQGNRQERKERRQESQEGNQEGADVQVFHASLGNHLYRILFP